MRRSRRLFQIPSIGEEGERQTTANNAAVTKSSTINPPDPMDYEITTAGEPDVPAEAAQSFRYDVILNELNFRFQKYYSKQLPFSSMILDWTS